MTIWSHRTKSIAVILALGTVGIASLAQTPARQKQRFEVASIKANRSGGPPGRLGTWGNLFIAENYPILLVIQRAYGFPDEWLAREQLSGGPNWLQTDRFDIEAKIEGDPRS